MLGLIVAAALVATGCGSDDDAGDSTAAKSDGPVTIEWWHIANNDPLKTIWQDAADQYMADHPNVDVKITVLENEAFKTKLTTTMQAGKVPDVFQSWGGGARRAGAGRARAGHQRADLGLDRRPQ